MPDRRPLSLLWHRVLLSAAIAICPVVLGACADTLQDQPIGPSALEAVMVKSQYPVYWLGLSFHGMKITNVTIDPGGAVTIRYGDCILGGQYTCVTPITIVSSPDNSFVPGAETANATVPVRGVTASVSKKGSIVAIPTGGVVVSVYARDASLARAGAAGMTPINQLGLPGQRLPTALADTGVGRMPLPSEVPAGVSVPQPQSE